MAKKKRPFKIAAVYDTETTTVGVEDAQQAFAYAYIWNRIADINLYQYEPERDDDLPLARALGREARRSPQHIRRGPDA